jgi:hypothetical protein
MPRNGAYTLADIPAEIRTVHLVCKRCARRGRYAVSRLVARFGADAAIPAVVDELAAGARCPNRDRWDGRCAVSIEEPMPWQTGPAVDLSAELERDLSVAKAIVRKRRKRTYKPPSGTWRRGATF